jgi:hypothetical protein
VKFAIGSGYGNCTLSTIYMEVGDSKTLSQIGFGHGIVRNTRSLNG